MTFKPLDLQMSIPRTQEFSNMQSQAVHKPVAEQNMLANQSAKETELMRKQNTSIEQSDKVQVRTNQDSPQDSASHDGSSERKQEEAAEHGEAATPVHPFKGHHLDIKL